MHGEEITIPFPFCWLVSFWRFAVEGEEDQRDCEVPATPAAWESTPFPLLAN